MKILKYSYLVAISLTLLFAGCSDSPTDSEEEPIVPTEPTNGNGSFANPYEIASLDNLVWISADTSRWSNHYIQTQDIDASGTGNSTFNDGKGFSPIGNQSKSFAGSYDGQGYTITNLYINRPDDNRIGFFGAASAMITNVHLVEADITGSKYLGALVGFNFDTISHSSVSGSLKGGNGSGGIVGACVAGGKIISSYNTASVMVQNDLDPNTANRIGGIAGIAKNCTIRNTYNIGDVRGHNKIGGIAGEVANNATVESTYNAGSVDNEGDENKDQNGGIVGVSQGGTTTFTNNYYDQDVTGSTVQNGDIGGTGKSTPDMMEQSTFNGWGFSSIWAIDSGSSYPYLQNNTQNPPPGS